MTQPHCCIKFGNKICLNCTEYNMLQRLAGNGVETLVCKSLVFLSPFLNSAKCTFPSSPPKKYRQCHQAVDPGDMYNGRC